MAFSKHTTLLPVIALGLFFFLFISVKAVFNTNVLGTDIIQFISPNSIVRLGTFSFGWKGGGGNDLSKGIFSTLKVLEDGRPIGSPVSWYKEVTEKGEGRYMHRDGLIFSTSDNTMPFRNGRSYAVSYNSLAWLNSDYVAVGFLACMWCIFWMFKENELLATILNAPLLWLGVFMVDRYVTHGTAASFILERTGDTSSYLQMDFSSLGAMLSSIRTIGYPIFMAFFPDFLLPHVQLVGYLSGIFVFAAGVGALLGGWIGLFAALPLVCSNGIYRLEGLFYITHQAPDGIALALALASVGFIFLAVKAVDARRTRWLVASCVTVFAGYIVRPAYLFLIPLLPVLVMGWVLFCAGRPRWKDEMRRLVVPTFLGVVLPFILFCGLRLAVVGHFGLVSFGGHNIVRIAGNFLDKETAGNLPESVRPFALSAADNLEAVGVVIPRGAGADETYSMIYRNYSSTVDNMGGVSTFCADNKECNQLFNALAQSVLRERFESYATWVWGALLESFRQFVRLGRWQPVIVWGGLLSVLFLCFMVVQNKGGVDVRRILFSEIFSCGFRFFLFTIICFFMLSVANIILVEPPLRRYLTCSRALIVPLYVSVIALFVRSGFNLMVDARARS